MGSMKVKVRSFATLREIMDKEIEMELSEGTTVAGLLEILCKRYKGLQEELFDSGGQLKNFVNILKNGRNVYFLDDMNTVLENSDDITIFPPVAGG
jgi:molybdopterin synthase sulfur carrier subunit